MEVSGIVLPPGTLTSLEGLMQEQPQGEATKPASQTFWTLRNFRDVSVGLLMLVVAIRIAFAKTTIDLSGFNFTDLLSLILAISAIALSAAFYFKADESSQNFYNNTYQFTKDVSEILGRIESGFGEKLAHINEGYAGLNQRIDSMPLGQHREEAEAKKAEILEQEAAISNIIDDLMKKAKLDEQQKQELNEKIERLNQELEESKTQLKSFENEAQSVWAGSLAGFTEEHLERLFKVFSKNFPQSSRRRPDGLYALRFKEMKDSGAFASSTLQKFEDAGVTLSGRLTQAGIKFINDLLARYRG